MKPTFLITFLFLGFQQVLCQNFANSWIKPDQPYVKLKVSETGIYRLYPADLENTSIDLKEMDPDHLHLYYRGLKQYMYIQKDTLGKALYVEFLGMRMDGGDDTNMYRDPTSGLINPASQTHPRLSLFSDTSAYFLTYSSFRSPLRYENFFDGDYDQYVGVSSFRFETHIDFDPKDTLVHYINGGKGVYDPFHSLNPSYGTGEGFLGGGFGVFQPFIFNFHTPFSSDDRTPILKTRIFGRSSSSHKIQISPSQNLNMMVLDTAYGSTGIFLKTFKRDLVQLPKLSAETQFSLRGALGSTGMGHLVWASLTYDRIPNLMGESSIIISAWDYKDPALIEFVDIQGQDSIYVYDTETGRRNIGLFSGNSAKVVISGAPTSRRLYLASDQGMRKPEVQDLSVGRLSDPGNEADLLLITHKSLETSARVFAMYKDTNQINAQRTFVAFIDEIYEEFGYGSPTPLAIQRFCNYAINNWRSSPKYVLLWGKAENSLHNNPSNLVPTYGFPPSDQYFVTPLLAQDREDLIPQIPIGRVSIRADKQGLAYLAKVERYEHEEEKEWRNTGIFFGGGGTLGEQNLISTSLKGYQDIFVANNPNRKVLYCQEALTFDPDSLCDVGINKGSGIIHFFGHSTANLRDVALDEAQLYTNDERYPLLIGMGSGSGDFTYDPNSFGERWVTEPNKGAIAFLGPSAPSYMNPIRDYGNALYPNLSDTTGVATLGEVMLEGLQSYLNSYHGIQYHNHALYINLQGDPSLRWRSGKENALGIENPRPDIQMKVFPNPVRSDFEVEVLLPYSGKIEIRLSDMAGRIVAVSFDYAPSGIYRKACRLSDLNEGIYAFQLVFDGYMYTQKLLIRE